MFCSKCGAPIPEGTSVCPKCGFSEEPATAKPKKMRRMVIGALSIPIWIPICIAAVAASAVGVTAAVVVVPQIIANRSESQQSTPVIASSFSSSSVSQSSEIESSSSSSEETQAATVSVSYVNKAIHVYENFSNYGAPCDFSHEDVAWSAYEQLSEDQRMWVSTLETVSCCKTVAEAQAHLEKYLDSSLTGNFNESNFLEYEGKLYILTGGVGYVSYDPVMSEDQINHTSDTTFSTTVNLYDSGGQLYSEVTFEFTYIDGSYIITNVTGI